jgi:hypothetical protein
VGFASYFGTVEGRVFDDEGVTETHCLSYISGVSKMCLFSCPGREAYTKSMRSFSPGAWAVIMTRTQSIPRCRRVEEPEQPTSPLDIQVPELCDGFASSSGWMADGE